MIDTTCRKRVQRGFDMVAKNSGLCKLTPNQITVFAFLAGVGAGIAVGFGNLVLGFILLWVSGGLDVLDGTVARLTNRSSNLGAYLDLVFDRLVEGVMILAFFLYKPSDAVAYFVFLIGAMFNFTTFMLAGALFKNEGAKGMHYDIGLVERTETFVTFALMMVVPQWSFIILMVFNALMILTGVLRLGRIIRYEKQNDGSRSKRSAREQVGGEQCE